jgi:uncharacterized protein YdaU (DUF1376 family)
MPMNGLPYYKAYPRDFFEGTVGMSGDLKGAYRMVLDLIYMHDGDLPDDAPYISGHLGLSIRQWGFYRKKLLDMGKLLVRGAFIASSRADQELFATRSYQDQQAINGARPKKIKHIPETTAKPPLSHTEPDIDTKREEKKESARDALALVVGLDLADAFVAHRRALRSPMTPHAGKLMARKLAAMSDPGTAIETAIERGWKTAFDPPIPFPKVNGADHDERPSPIQQRITNAAQRRA